MLRDDAHNKLLWANHGTNAAPTTGQANPYRLYTYNGNGEPTSIEHRDTTGSPVVTDALEWDGMGKLRRVTSGGTVVYTAVYDGAGDRVQSTQSGATHTYSYGAGLLYDSVGSTTYTPGVSHRQAGVDSYYHEDWIGSNRNTTDSTGLATQSGQRWDAFGNLTANAGSHGGSLRWVGGHGYEADGPLGMSVLGARNYDPSVGRFLSADPIGIAGGINQFSYCGGDPVNYADPSGLLREAPPEQVAAVVAASRAAGLSAAAGGSGGVGGAVMAVAPVALIAVTVGASADLTRYAVTGKNGGGGWSPTWWGDRWGKSLGAALYPDGKYGAAPGFYARWMVDRSRDSLNAADAGCGGGGGGGGGKPPAPPSGGDDNPGGYGDLTPEEISKLQDIANKYNQPVYVFGSAAKGTRGPGSDLDIGISPNLRGTELGRQMAGELETVFRNQMNWHGVMPFQNMGNPYIMFSPL